MDQTLHLQQLMLEAWVATISMQEQSQTQNSLTEVTDRQPSPCWNPEYDQNLAIQLCSLNSTNGSILLAFSVPCLGCIFHTLSLTLCKPAHSHMDLFGATENCWSLRGEFYYGLKFWAMLYVYSLNFWTGPKMEPCGTPLVTSYHSNFNQQFHTARKALLL